MSKNKSKNKKNKRNYTRLIDLLLNILLLALCAFGVYKVYRLNLIPEQWLMIGALLLLAVFLIFFVLMFIRLPNWGVILKRLILCALCGVIAYASYTIGNVNTAVEKITINDVESNPTIEIKVLTLKSSGIKSVQDLNGGTVGVQVGTDKDSSTYGKTQLLGKSNNSFTFDEEIDYTTLTTLFMSTMIDAMIVTEDYLPMLESNVEGFSDCYNVITTYERARPANPSNLKDIAKESFTLLISGVDSVGAADMSTLSDVNIMLFINPVSNQITMASVPRDTFVPHAALNYENDKLTHTGPYGIKDTVDTLENFFDIDIDYYAKVSFSSLIEIVDALGGIEVDVEIAFSEQDENRSFEDGDLITLEKGVQTLNGKQALAYSRHRKTENYDVAGRERAQERIIKAIIDKLLSPQGVTTYANRLLEIVPNYVVTDMPGKQISAFIKGELQNLKPWTIQSITMENGAYDSRPVPNVGIASTYLFNQFDYISIRDAYFENKKNLTFDEFNFDLSDLSKYLPEIDMTRNIVWDFEAIDPY